MQNGPDLAKRFYKELTDMQVRARKFRWFWLLSSVHRMQQLLKVAAEQLKGWGHQVAAKGTAIDERIFNLDENQRIKV